MDKTDLLKLSEDQLLDMIGARARQAMGTPEGPDIRGLGPEDLHTLGKNIFNRINRELHQLFCGSTAEDKDQREELAKIFRLDPAMGQAALTIFLISTIGLDSTIAAAVAVLLLKRVILPAGGEICEFWNQHLTI
jgi:hypothetical protein